MTPSTPKPRMMPLMNWERAAWAAARRSQDPRPCSCCSRPWRFPPMWDRMPPMPEAAEVRMSPRPISVASTPAHQVRDLVGGDVARAAARQPDGGGVQPAVEVELPLLQTHLGLEGRAFLVEAGIPERDSGLGLLAVRGQALEPEGVGTQLVEPALGAVQGPHAVLEVRVGLLDLDRSRLPARCARTCGTRKSQRHRTHRWD